MARVGGKGADERTGSCIRCGMCCGDEANGYCEHMIVAGAVGDPGSTACAVYDRLNEVNPGCLNHPQRAKEIYPWYRCGYRFAGAANGG